MIYEGGINELVAAAAIAILAAGVPQKFASTNRQAQEHTRHFS